MASDYTNIPGVLPDDQANMSVDPNATQPVAPAVVEPAKVAAGSQRMTNNEMLMNAFPSAIGYVPRPDRMKPENIIKDPNASEEDKFNALSAIQFQERENAEKEAMVQLDNDKEATKNFQAYQQQLDKVNAFNADAEKYGAKKLEIPDPAKFKLDPATIARLSQPEVQAQVEPAMQQDREQQKLVEEQKQDKLQQIQAQKQLQNKAVGEDRTMIEAQESMKKAMLEMETEQKQLDNVDPDRWWNSRTTGQKIMAYIGLALGGGPTSKGNAAMDMINGAIDKDIAAQKVNQEKALALKQNAIKRVQMEIERFGALSKDAERKQQAKMLQAQLGQQAAAVQNEALLRRKVAHAITAGDGITAEDAYVLDPEGKLRDNLVSMPNGKLKAAANKEAAKEFSKWNQGMVGAESTSKELIEQVKNMSSLERLKPKLFSDQQRNISTTVTKLIGELRLPFTGPGILTPTEYDRLMENVVGDPNSVFQSKGLVLSQLAHLQNLLKSTKMAQYEAAGVNVDRNDPEYKRQMKLKAYMKQNLGEGSKLTPQQVEIGARKLGLIK